MTRLPDALRPMPWLLLVAAIQMALVFTLTSPWFHRHFHKPATGWGMKCMSGNVDPKTGQFIPEECD